MFLQLQLAVLTWQDQSPVAQVFQEMINARQVPLWTLDNTNKIK